MEFNLGLSLLCALLLAGVATAEPPVASAQSIDANLPAFDFREVVQQAKQHVFPAVVFVKCVRESHERGKRETEEVAGSGVLISTNGEILTNWHVVDKAVEVRCLLYDGTAAYADIQGTDPDLDLALIKLVRTDSMPATFPCATLGNSEALTEGDFVMAMGAPWGLVRSVSIGIISCTQRYLEGNSEYSLWLQTDASISPGNSGGPLVNTVGEVVGINTLGIFFGGDMGFAVPSSTIREILPRLREHGNVNWAWTGLELEAIRDFNRNVYFDGTNGVVVAGALPASPATEADIHPCDRILSIAGEPVNGLTEESLPSIRRRIALLDFDKPATLTLTRDGKPMTVTLTPRRKGAVQGQELDCPRWDLTVKAINQFENPGLYFQRKQGVFIFGLESPGNAANAGLSRNDIILKIDDQPVATLDDIRHLYEQSLTTIQTKPRLRMTLLRNGMMRQTILEFAYDYEKE